MFFDTENHYLKPLTKTQLNSMLASWEEELIAESEKATVVTNATHQEAA